MPETDEDVRGVRISPETFRQIASQVTDEAIIIRGQKLALTPENAPQIRAALQEMKKQLNEARALNPPSVTVISILHNRLEAILEEVGCISRRMLYPNERGKLAALATFAVERWTEMLQNIVKRADRDEGRKPGAGSIT